MRPKTGKIAIAAVLVMLASAVSAAAIPSAPAQLKSIRACEGSVKIDDANTYVALILDRSGSYDLKKEWAGIKQGLKDFAGGAWGLRDGSGPLTLRIYYVGDTSYRGIDILSVKWNDGSFGRYWSKVCFGSLAPEVKAKEAEAANLATQDVLWDSNSSNCSAVFTKAFKNYSPRPEPVTRARLDLVVCKTINDLRKKVAAVKTTPMCSSSQPCSNIIEAVRRAAAGRPTGEKSTKCIAMLTDGMNFDRKTRSAADATNMYYLLNLNGKSTQDYFEMGRKVGRSSGIEWGRGSLAIQQVGFGYPNDWNGGQNLSKQDKEHLRAWWKGFWNAFGVSKVEDRDSSEVCQGLVSFG